MLEELQKVVGELYALYGATTQVVKLSQILDELIVEAQKINRGLLFMKTSRDNKILEMYYECALKEVADQKEEIEYLKNKLVEASRRIQELEGENLIWTQRCSRAEGKLNRAKNIIAMLTGREEW